MATITDSPANARRSRPRSRMLIAEGHELVEDGFPLLPTLERRIGPSSRGAHIDVVRAGPGPLPRTIDNPAYRRTL